jgi:polyphosphate kinase
MPESIQEQINRSDLISRDLSWLRFNYRVLDQARKAQRNIFEKLKFLAITSSNADEFFQIRVGSLYNYLDFGKERLDYSGLREEPFKKVLLNQLKGFSRDQNELFLELKSQFAANHFDIVKYNDLNNGQRSKAEAYFKRKVFPTLTPMVFDQYHSFPILVNNVIIFGVITRDPNSSERRKISYIQIPSNLPRFFEIEEDDFTLFIPIEEIIAHHLDSVFKYVEVLSYTVFRLTRNGDFTLEESEDIETNFLEELKSKLKTRKTGRVVRIEIAEGFDPLTVRQLRRRFEVTDENFKMVPNEGILDYTGFEFTF